MNGTGREKEKIPGLASAPKLKRVWFSAADGF